MLYEHMFVLCSAVRNVYTAVGNVHTAVGNVHTAVGNVHSALRNIKQKPFSDTITNSFRDFYRRLSLYQARRYCHCFARTLAHIMFFYFLLSLLSLIMLTIIYTGGYIVMKGVIEE